jgi:hypothetical protein
MYDIQKIISDSFLSLSYIIIIIIILKVVAIENLRVTETGISAAGGESSTGDGGLSLLKVANITLNPGPTYDNYTASDHENTFRCLVS